MEETEISFDEVDQPAARQSKLAILLSGIGRLTKPEPEPAPKEDPAADFGKFADQLLDTFTAQEERIEQLSARNDELTARVKALGDQVAGFRKTLDETPQTFYQRQPISGPGRSVGDATDC